MPQSVSTTALADPSRETTAKMAGNLCRGDQVAEARLTGTGMAHLLICCPQRLNDPE
jgi:hypothetical protein